MRFLSAKLDTGIMADCRERSTGMDATFLERVHAQVGGESAARRRRQPGGTGKPDAILLDFYHLSGHIWETARCCLGHGQEADKWASDQLSEIKHVGARSVIDAIDTLATRFRAQAKQESLRKLRQYIIQRWEMVEYPGALARGWDIGSGPTEAMCKNLTLRLKRTGMKWDQETQTSTGNTRQRTSTETNKMRLPWGLSGHPARRLNQGVPPCILDCPGDTQERGKFSCE